MAKDSDNLAGSLDTEHIGGLLSGLLAEEEPFDRHALWRLGSWGVGAVGAVIVGLLASQSSVGWRHEQIAAVDLARQSQQIQSVARESQNETRRLASAIDTLNGDRDRLYSRLTVVEQGLESVTGTIARQKSAPASQAPPVTSATPGPAPAPMSTAAVVQAATQSPNPPPVIGPVATTAPSSAERPHMDAANAPVSPSTVATVVHATPAAAPATAAANPAATAPAATAAAPVAGASTPAATSANPAPLTESKSMMAPPDAAAAKLTEPDAPKNDAKNDAKNAPPNDAPNNPEAVTPAPDVIASAPPAAGAEPDATQSITPAAVQRTEFAVDVGGANSVGGLRALWRGLLKSRSNAPLAALHPIIVVRESNNGLGMQLRLVAGPLNDAAAAAKICATMIENKRSCETTVFDGQRLAMKTDAEPPAPAAAAPTAATRPVAGKPAAGKPASVRSGGRRHGYTKRVVSEEPVDKPDPPSTLSTLSSYFGKR